MSIELQNALLGLLAALALLVVRAALAYARKTNLIQQTAEEARATDKSLEDAFFIVEEQARKGLIKPAPDVSLGAAKTQVATVKARELAPDGLNKLTDKQIAERFEAINAKTASVRPPPP